jgi:RimJ/RimL family protein N-acetyltransferase
MGGGIIWLEVVGDEGLGMYLIHPHNCVTYEIHTCLLPTAWGDKAKQAAKLVLNWIFQNTPCMKVITHVPETNALALRYAKRAGMVVEGNNRKSFLKNGQLLDQIQLGITKEEHICQQQQW